MKKFAATNGVIPDRIKKRMSSRRVSPLSMGVNPHLLMKNQRNVINNVKQKGLEKMRLKRPFTTELMIEKIWSQALSIAHSGRHHTLQITIALQVVIPGTSWLSGKN